MTCAGPLAGLRVLVTRAREQASDLSERLSALGAIPVEMASIEIQPTDEPERLDDALRNLAAYDWCVLTSVNGVAAVAERLDALGMPRSALGIPKLAVIGPATGEALRKACREPDLMPESFVAEAILEKLGDVSGKRFLLARADLARKELAIGLRERGALVDEVVAYKISPARARREVLDGPCPDALTFTSSSAVRNTLSLLREAGDDRWFREAPIFCIGPVTAGTVRELGFEVAAVAEEFTIPGLVDALVAFVGTGTGRTSVGSREPVRG